MADMKTTTNLQETVQAVSGVPNFPDLEEQVLSYWENTLAFEQSLEQREHAPRYVFYDGPPFATGMPHYGHLLASTTKDVIPRYWTMKGYRVDRVWGWDCHGLPIENMIEKQLGITNGKKGIEELGIATFNQACRTEVLRLDTEWEKIIGRLGRWVDFKHNYKTMDTSFMESVWWGFKQLYEKDLVYQGKRVILYCPRCATPLSNFEIAMDNSYQEVTETGTTYKYRVLDAPNTYLLAWSTTPWNKLATPALAVHPDHKYVTIQQGDDQYILLETRLEAMVHGPYTVVATHTGNELTELQFEPHYDFFPERQPQERIGVVVADPFVTDEEGTGIVTLAAYGEDDFRVMQANQIQLIEHVTSEGKLKPEVTPWAGLDILKANPLIDDDLRSRGLLYHEAPHTHTVPTCYRCGTRLYYAPVPAWFIDIQKIKSQLVQENENINWFPEHLKHGRFQKGLESAPDWNVSRSRYWGTPMPIWAAEDGSLRVIGSVAELQEWAVDAKQAAKITDIHRESVDEIAVWVDDARTKPGKRIPEVFDCWVESGSMPFAAIHYPFENKDVFEKNYPAQFVSEYIAQTRAWFYTMHVMSVGLFGKPSFENVLTTGTILAEDGTKMSKSKKNYPDPMEVISEFGVDSLRLYLMSSPVMKGENLNFNKQDVADIRRNVFVIWWNLVTFATKFTEATDPTKLPPQPEHILDQWLLRALGETIQTVTTLMDSYDVVKTSRVLMDWITTLSTWYVRLSRDRLKQSASTQACYRHALWVTAQLFAPICPFFSELVHHSLSMANSSIHTSDWPKVEAYMNIAQPELVVAMQVAQKIVEAGHAARQLAKLKVRQPLAKATVHPTHDQKPLLESLPALHEVIMQELNVKVVEIAAVASELHVTLDTALTPELKAEGEARELMRSIQSLRKTAGLQPNQHATVSLPSWPQEWQEAIEVKTNTTLTVGDTLAVVG